ncbi:hypothetical protein [Bacillus weihaiensis]|uniref:hypothetical protein n=1 Tax=Bacillus weihaiensis TaxID=1547283 RepID=UPI00235742A7|nr:hypothetical protein [Bacillus weihaiensis]
MAKEKFKLVPFLKQPILLEDYRIKDMEDQYNEVYDSMLRYQSEHNKEKAADIMWNLNSLVMKIGYKFVEVK